MNILKRHKTPKSSGQDSAMSELVLKTIHDGVVITDKNGIIQFINPAAVLMTGCSSADAAIGLDYGLIIRLESKEGRELSENENPLIQAMKTNQPLDHCQVLLISASAEKRIPISVTVLTAEGLSGNRIITFRDITKELEEEGEQTEFISTASHEMRTPVATIDGYLSLALNPQTATIDERARGYLTAAEKASKHLGKLFQNLLDITKLDDGKIRPHFQPIEMVSAVESIANNYAMRAKEAKINYTFGSDQSITMGAGHRMQQVVYGFIDPDFLCEIMDNLIENAIKYTPEGGSIYVNVRGDGDRTLINVTDTGIGISADDLAHVFQKFYRVDNTDTRTIGGTGLGLYLVKQRAEAMGGKVWAESAFGEGSTFYVSLPRISSDEYEKRMIIVRNQEAAKAQIAQNLIAQSTQPTPPQTAFQVAAMPNRITPTNAQHVAQPIQPAIQVATIPQPTTPPIQVATIPQPNTSPIQAASSPPPTPPNPTPPNPTPAPTPPSTPAQNQINNNLNGELK